MSRPVKIIISIVTVVLILTIAGVLLLNKAVKAAKEFQHDANIVRLRHIEYYGNLIEEYHRKTGKLPLQGLFDSPTYVHIANREQRDDIKGGPQGAHEVVPTKEFFAALEKALGREIDEHYDMQYEPAGCPNFYLYMVYRDTYFLAVHLSQPLAMTKTLGPRYHKLEISNKPNPQNRAITLENLLNHPEFKKASYASLLKPGFSEARQKLHKHDSAN